MVVQLVVSINMIHFARQQDIYIEEERHQRAMMAIESSVLDCGSDNWSVDSDYAFQDFADDDPQQPKVSDPNLHISREREYVGVKATAMAAATPATTTTTAATVIVGVRGGRTSSSATASNPEDEVERINLHAVKFCKEYCGEDEPTPDVEATRLWDAGARGVNRRVGKTGVGREEHAACGARLFGDPGSSTDSTHILRLEQRMFLKVMYRVSGVTVVSSRSVWLCALSVTGSVFEGSAYPAIR